MIAEPDERPVTTPVVGTTEATDKLLLLHIPPPLASLSVVLSPSQVLAVPVTEEGSEFTNTDVDVLHPVDEVKLMLTRPEDTPLTEPVNGTTDATATLPDDHVPLPVLISVTEFPTQTLLGPVIAAGNGLTLTFVVVMHPVGNVYVIVAPPATTPDTTPLPLTVATDGLLLDQKPPGEALPSDVVPPDAHAVVMPVMPAGKELIATEVETEHPVTGNV